MFVCAFFFTLFLCAFTTPLAPSSSDTLDEIGRLINELKDLDAKSADTATHRVVPVYREPRGRECAVSERLKYKECFAYSENIAKKQVCVFNFTQAYCACFYGSYLQTGLDNPAECENNCLNYFDQCLYDSSKVEEFICINGRDACRNSCPMQQQVVVKRGCHQTCAGEFQLCEQHCSGPIEVFLCSQNEAACRAKCKKR